MNVKKKLFCAVGKLFNSLACICPSIKCNISVEQAKQILLDSGYNFQPLWAEIPNLKARICDLSLIVPVFNSEKFLAKCLDSLCNQKTNYKYEVICINDGSTDGSQQIIEQFQKKYNNVVVHFQQNGGISSARNKGIELSTGRYIGFIDNDDTVSKDYVQTLLDTANNTDADLIQCGYTEISLDGNLIRETCNKDLVIENTDKKGLFDNVQGYILGGIVKAEMFPKVRFPMNFWYEDMLTRMLLMRLVKRFAIVGKNIYKKTVHEQNASKTLWKNKNIKSVDQFWLALQFADYASSDLALSPDQLLYNTLLSEWSLFLWGRTRGLPERIKKSVFALVSEYIDKMNFNENDCFHSELRCVAKSIHNKCYCQWQLSSLSLLIKSISQ